MQKYSIVSFLKPADFITILNAVSGFLSIIFLINENFVVGIGLMFVSAFLDFIDGKVARALGKTTEFGKALDFADLISFGVAPTVLVSIKLPGPLTYLVASI